MKKVQIVCSAILLAFIFLAGNASVEAKSEKVVSYKNCTELNKVYKGGVARAANVKNKGGKTKYAPFVSQALYDANKSKDRDKDLIACER